MRHHYSFRTLRSAGRWASVLLLSGAVPLAAQDDPPAPPSPPRLVEAISLLGDSLWRPVIPAEAESTMMAQLREAERDWAANPDDAEAVIWAGRRTAYLGRYVEAIGVFSMGLIRHPEDARFYRHRGHRYITTRQLDRAITDFRYAARLTRGHADQVEPDGQPNAMGIPTSTLQSNIWYHLGLAYYLKGDFRNALDAYRRNLEVAANPDMQVAVRHWLYMTLRRLGRTSEAADVLRPVTRDLDVIENTSYHRLLLLYKGELTLEDLTAGAEADAVQNATIGYGIGNWHFYNGRREDAMRVFRQVIEGESWAAFGYIAAEAELARGARR